MFDNLIFGGLYKRQTCSIAQQAGDGTQGPGRAVEQRIEHTGTGIEIPQSILTPHQMINLFIARCAQRLGDLRVASCCGLAVIERLSTDLPRVIHPHETSRVPGILQRQFFLNTLSGISLLRR